MSSLRNKRILMDSLSGIPMQKIADREGIHLSRVGQIVKREKERIRWHLGMTKQQAGAASWRRPHWCWSDVSGSTPESYYHEVVNEERTRNFYAGS